MNKTSRLAASAALACFAAAALAQTPPPLDVRATMQGRVNPAVLAIWGIGNHAMNDDGALDPARLDDGEWTELAAQAAQLAAAGRDMAAAQALSAAAPANAEVADGEVTMAHVQGLLNRDLPGFRQRAAEMEAHANQLAAAATARDPAATNALIGEIDAVCESCHAQFWYGE